jgi:magnesium transporter
MMTTLDLKNILESVDENRITELRASFDEYLPQDIAEEYHELDKDEQKTLFDILSYKQGARVLVELESDEALRLFKELSDEQIARFANEMELDDAADIIGMLEDERMATILERIQRPFELKALLEYETHTCGGIMSPHFISVRGDLKCNAAVRYVRLKAKEIGSQIVYVYVTQKFGELAGVISLRELFLASDNDAVADHMTTDVVSVNVNSDREEAAELISKYHFLALPVINENDQLVGIITIDDAVEVIEEEATADIYQSSGINVEAESDITAPSLTWRSYYGAYKTRSPWLIITLLGQYLAATIIAGFDSTVVAVPIAISFMPLLSGLSGNIGNQSTTIIVRGISTGEIDLKDAFSIFFHELLVSIAIGTTCATLTGLMSYFVYHNLTLSLLIAFSLLLSMALAVSLGTVTPMIFKQLDIDPAVASGPLITTTIDILSFTVYLTLISKFVAMLV